ncbi:MAG: M36 family metallopeptidase [Ferruginibacter sp.]|nr:M36 family metallopeptidase [Ferruginibacter sp.]
MLKKFSKTTFNIMVKLLLIIFISFSTFNAVAQKEVAFTKQYLNENTQKYNLSLLDITDMKVTSEYLSPTTGWYHIYFNQTLQSIDVYNAVLGITIKDNKVAYAANSFVGSLVDKMPVSNDAIALSAKDALLKAIRDVTINGIDISQTKQISSSKLDNGKVSKVVFEDKNLSDENIVVKLYWLPIENKMGEKINTSIALAWNVKFLTKDAKHSWNIQVDANTGNILQKLDDIIHCDFGTPEHENHNEICRDENVLEPTASPTANGYTVFDYPLEAPTFGARTLVTNPYTRFLPAGMGPGVTNGWHNDGATNYINTRGNNVWAKDDIAADNETTIGSSPSSATLDFNYTYTQATATAAANLNASITNLFYWNNVIHDVLWRFGFDEPSGNFQKDNLGKGGLGNDFVNADAQDGSGTNNANFSTPVDGGSGRMQMFIWSNAGSPLYQPDSDFDNGIISHEYGHGWSIRLTGGPANSSCLQNAEQGGEGWADYNGLMLTTNWAALTPTLANANIPRGIGTYVLGQSPTTGAGIRRYRYSYDKATYNNVVTYGKVADATNFSQPHGIGSIWATMLWDMTWEIILQDNFIAPNIYDVPTVVTNMRGNIAAYKLVTEGLRLQACSPSFVQARDAIFQADVLLFGGRYRCAIGRAFARRGLGSNASTGVSTNDRIVTESFTGFSVTSLTSPINNTVCSKQTFNYIATVTAAGTYTFAWVRATVVGISNAAGSGSTATINEILTNTTSSPVTVQYLFTVSPDECGGAPLPQAVNVIVNPSVTATVDAYSICQNGVVPVGQGLVVPAIQTNSTNGTIVVGPTYNRGTGTTTYVAATAGGVGSSVYFKTISFVAPSTAAVTFTITAASLTPGTADDSYMAIYQTAFNSASPATNFLRADDDAGAGALSLFTQNLTAGVTYVIVVSTYTNNVTGTFSLQTSTNLFAGMNSWYLNLTGGSALATGEIFNPVGIAGSGIANTATAGITTFYVSNDAFPNCRTATIFTINRNMIYVNQANTSGTYDGNTWATAYNNLEDALNATVVCAPAQVWVAAGTYKPTLTTNRDMSFVMKNNLAVYGGFPNTGNPTFAQRNTVSNITTLSGDIGITNDATDNSYHVISNVAGLNNTAILDGFVITNGNANGTGSFRNAGAGMLNNAGGASGTCNPIFDNCIFKNNSASLNGGAIYNNGVNATASPVFTNCVFQNNNAANGAAFYNDGSTSGVSNPIIVNTTFIGNTASASGNVVYSTAVTGSSTADFTNCIFWNNGGANTFFINAAGINVKYSLFEPLVNNYTNGAGNLTTTVSPFVLPLDAHLKDSSSAIDAGTKIGAPVKDIEFMVRTNIPDMGAYENLQSCIGSNKIYYSDVVGTTYQWQKNDGTGYIDIINGALYNNTNTQKLTLVAPASSTTGALYRCKITTGATVSYSAENIVRFYNRWLGVFDNSWQNAANWSCGVIPDQFTDVIIPSAKPLYPISIVNATIRKLQSESGSNITIATGSNLIISGQ